MFKRVIHAGIAHPELAKSSLGVLAFEAVQTKIRGFVTKARAFQYCVEQVGL